MACSSRPILFFAGAEEKKGISGRLAAATSFVVGA